jgi:putative tricarboxylic transport membrane protein
VKTLEFSTGLVLFALTVLAFSGTQELPIWEDVSPGPRFMPAVVAMVAGVVALGLLVHAWSKADAPSPEWPHAVAARRVLLTAGIGGFLIIIPGLGFVPSAAILVLFILLVGLRRTLMPSLAATAVTVGLIQGVFVSWLRVPLPKGPLGL